MNIFDHYYSRTALLAARDELRGLRRTIVVLIACASLVPLLLIGSPIGPQGSMRYVAAAVSVCGLALAWWWGRMRRPGRNHSWIVVAVGTACVAVTCLLPAEPLVGLACTCAFSIITSYAALMHSRGVLIVTWVSAGLVVCGLSIQLAMTDVRLALGGALGSALVIGGTSAFCLMAVRLIDLDEVRHPSEIDPLTGLLNHQAFLMHTATMVGSHSRHDDQYLVVVAVGVDDMTLLRDMDGTDSTVQAQIVVGQVLRETVRRKVPLAHVSDGEFLIADVFKTDDPSPLVDRIRNTINTTPMRLTASIGTACSPLRPLIELPTEQVVDALMELAIRSMNESRAAGGNRTTYAHFPTPNSDPDGPA